MGSLSPRGIGFDGFETLGLFGFVLRAWLTGRYIVWIIVHVGESIRERKKRSLS